MPCSFPRKGVKSTLDSSSFQSPDPVCPVAAFTHRIYEPGVELAPGLHIAHMQEANG